LIKNLPGWAKIAIPAAVALAVAAGGAALLVHGARDRAAESADHQRQDEELITAAKTAVETDAPEAQSISFGEVFAHRDGSVASVCGAVDIVQPDDGFDGAERFIYSEGDLKREETDGGDVLTRKWQDLCV
jgi:hypothetical protein